jgi:hypothetical protein
MPGNGEVISMTVVSEFDARLNMKGFIDRAARPMSDWYAGTAVDARTRLLEHHGVNEEHDWWIYEEIDSAEGARNVEQFLVRMGASGGQGDGDQAGTHVYCYAKEEHTNP